MRTIEDPYDGNKMWSCTIFNVFICNEVFSERQARRLDDRNGAMLLRLETMNSCNWTQHLLFMTWIQYSSIND